MKTQPVIPKTESFEDLVFEGRNKSYGAYELNRKRSRYLLVAFFISFTGIATCIAVPFINAFTGGNEMEVPIGSTPIELTPVNTNPEVPLPPPPPPIKSVEKLITSVAPRVVEEASDEFELVPTEDLIDKSFNKPVDIDIIPVVPNDPVIPEEEEDKIDFFPSEQASFRGGDLNTFRKWVAENMKYPPEAQTENIFGKVIIEFCVNKKGEVVDIKVLRSLHPAVDEATIKVISSSPKWTPAKQGGTPVKTRYVIPFMFDLI